MTDTPAERPLARLLFLDLETTGLDPRADHILEIAWIRPPERYDAALPLDVATMRSYLPFLERRDITLPLSVATMHAKSGLLVEREDESKLTMTSEIVGEFYETLDSLSIKGGDSIDGVVYDGPTIRPQLAGYSVHFDLEFLRAQMPECASLLSHRVMNVSSLRDFFARVIKMQTEGTRHRALDDCRHALHAYTQMLEFARVIPSACWRPAPARCEPHRSRRPDQQGARRTPSRQERAEQGNACRCRRARARGRPCPPRAARSRMKEPGFESEPDSVRIGAFVAWVCYQSILRSIDEQLSAYTKHARGNRGSKPRARSAK